MLGDYAAVVGKIFLLLLLGGSALLLGRRWRLRQPGLRLLIVLLALSLPGFALERRHSEFVTVRANETVDDTLLASGNIVRVEGVVNGDLLAFGGTVEVRGTVKGDLVSFAKRIVVSGTVEGNIFNFSNSLDLDGQLGHSIYGLMQSLRVNDRGRVGERYGGWRRRRQPRGRGESQRDHVRRQCRCERQHWPRTDHGRR